MFPLFSRCISLILLSLVYANASADTMFSVENEIDVHYKKQLPIYLQHDLGDVTITGWNQDLIRVKYKKSVTADTEENAKVIFKKFDLISLETPQAIELRIGTPQGTDILSKLRNRQQKKNIKIDLEIKAPSSLAFSIVLGTMIKLKLLGWRGKINITGKNNSLELSKLRASFPLSLNCVNCSLLVNDSEFSGSIFVSDQKIELKKTRATPQPILIFSQKGEVSMENTQGDFQIRSQSGDMNAKGHQGGLQVQSDSGKVRVEELEGNLDLQTQTGDIKVLVKKVLDQLEIKNRSGQIDITLPHDFEGDVNLQSIKGDVSTDFTIQKNKKKMEMLYGPEIKGRLFGTIGTNSSVNVSVSSESGKINLKQKDLPQ